MSIEFFGDKLKSVRKSRHLTQLELSKRLDVSKGTISAYEQSLSYPSIETLTRLCFILDTSADYLLGISDDLPFKMGGLTDEQVESVLQFVSVIEKANEINDRAEISGNL
ncbi:transcriptional regulator [Lactococcus cremoris]|uniref:Transcriptional regulator- Cro/CI family n=1 Tax=Lactococcus lactis subsp. cremoris TaxID=1359 RepID=A0A854XWQ9_LACLC|nr:helix-turn-helix transcriptional regulator [Lactococcus cremoris]EUN34580.1 HTH domain-containing protein [Lactococcus cremoris subsp. cremoris HP]KZK09955.1 SOS-response repressor and protease LexA [Lactococcus cremoris]KZK41255.1 SOS-response repressor and protease LexA [Lactococcus cremoris]MCT4399947.1 XRE family transcriptional regulator [Lactococcus cremoris]MCT4429256.1 XRE family transcriptional regulator [Lactococcus cremoris]